MTENKKFRRVLTFIVAIISFTAGFEYAIGEVNTLKRLIIAETEGSTKLTILAATTPEIDVAFDKTEKQLTLRVKNSVPDRQMKNVKYADDIIESITVAEDEELGNTVITVRFKPENVVFYQSSPLTGKGSSFDFRPIDKRIRIAGKLEDHFTAGVHYEKEPGLPADTASKAESDAIAEQFADIDKQYGELEELSGRKYYIEIMKKLQKREFEEVVDLSDKFIAAFPKSHYSEIIYYSKADALYNLTKYESKHRKAALDAYTVAMSEFPKSHLYPTGLMRKADIYSDEEFYIEAITEYGGLLKNFSKGKYATRAMLRRAGIYIKQGKYQAAYNELERILILYPKKREVRDAKYLIAETFHDQGMFKKAGIIFTEAISAWPTYPKTRPSTYLKIANTWFELGQYKKAMDEWFMIANLFPTQVEGRVATLKLGELNVKLKKKKEGAKIFEAMIRSFPDKDEAVLARMRLASLGAEDPDLIKESMIFNYDAFSNPIATLNDVIKKHEEKYGMEALERKGDAYAQRKRFIASIVAFKELLRNYPKARMSEAVYNKVRANFFTLIDTYHAQDGFFMALLTYYNNFNPFLRNIKDPAMLKKIAESFHELTLYERAKDYYMRTAAYDKKNLFAEDIAFGISKATLEGGHPKEGEKMFKRFIATYPASNRAIDARFYLGRAMLAQGREAEAITEWRIATELKPNHQEVGKFAYETANIYKKRGRYVMAIDAYNSAIISFNPDVNRKQQLERIKESYYHIAEASYLDQEWQDAIKSAERFTKLYPEDTSVNWMEYMISSSLDKIEMRESATKKLEIIAKNDKDTLLGRIAQVRLENRQWKNKNPELFSN
ncbi:hypothetical protein MNBD_NITROSPINAE01-139 [hydrothermal vent metagenome]|uniref:Uncharacterized protein n=1 Tax=hydrothermal vent metagenome TaxID=652676 RepID=A0A3B1CNT9_9ZZZZ